MHLHFHVSIQPTVLPSSPSSPSLSHPSVYLEEHIDIRFTSQFYWCHSIRSAIFGPALDRRWQRAPQSGALNGPRASRFWSLHPVCLGLHALPEIAGGRPPQLSKCLPISPGRWYSFFCPYGSPQAMPLNDRIVIKQRNSDWSPHCLVWLLCFVFSSALFYS